MSVPGPLASELKALFGSGIGEARSDPPFEVIHVRPSSLVEVVGYLKSVKGLDMLMDLTAVDRLHGPERDSRERFELVYYLMPSPAARPTGLSDRPRVRMKVRVGGSDPRVPSLTSLFGNANWLEREAWDMFGIRFDGHPDLRRILLYEEFSGHPLRKDYPLKKEQPRVAQLFARVPPFGRPPGKVGTEE